MKPQFACDIEMRQHKSQPAQIKSWASNGIMVGKCGVLCTVLRLVYRFVASIIHLKLVRSPQITTTI